MKTLLHISCTWIITSLFITITNFSFFKKEKSHLKHFCTLTKTSKEEEEKVKHWFLLLKTKWKKEKKKKIPQIKSQTQKPNQPNKSGERYLLVGWWKNLWEIDSKLLWIGSIRSGGTGRPATIYLKIKAWCSSSCHCDTVKGDLIPVPIPVPLTLPPPTPPPPVLFISTTINQYSVLSLLFTLSYMSPMTDPESSKLAPWDREKHGTEISFCLNHLDFAISVCHTQSLLVVFWVFVGVVGCLKVWVWVCAVKGGQWLCGGTPRDKVWSHFIGWGIQVFDLLSNPTRIKFYV